MSLLYALLAAIGVSLVSVIAAIPLLVVKQVPRSILLLLLSLSAGALIGVVFVHFIPEIVAHGYTIGTVVYVLLGFVVLFVAEKFLHHHHHHRKHHNHNEEKCEMPEVHAHAYHLGPLNIIGEMIHNFIDGLVIAGSFIVSVPLGIAATISIILHELPLEIADMGVLLYSGMSKLKALFFNGLAATTAILGVLLGTFLHSIVAGFTAFVLPFAVGNFLYIALSNLVPELQKEYSLKATISQLAMFVVGVGLMIGMTFLGLGHAH